MTKIKKITIFLSLFISINIIAQTEYNQNSELISVLDRVITTEKYWNEIQYQPKKWFFHTLPWNWFSSHKNELKKKCSELKKTRKDLARTLGKNQSKNHSIDDAYSAQMIQQAQKKLNEHKTPHHFKRNWMKYFTASIGVVTLYVMIQKKLNNEILFIIKGPSLRDPLKGTLKTNEYHYTRNSTHQFLRITKKDEEQVRSLLQEKQDTLEIRERRPTEDDSSLYFYDEYGVNIFRTFYEDHILSPIQGVKSILFNEIPNEAILTTDIEYQTKKFIQNLDQLIIKAQNIESSNESIREIQSIIHSNIGNNPIEKASLSSKKNILTAIIQISQKKIPTIVSKITSIKRISTDRWYDISYKKDMDGALSIFSQSMDAFENISEENKDFFSLTTEAFFLHFIQRDLQLSAIINKAHNVSEKVNLNIHLMAVMPTLIATYGTYHGIKSFLKRINRSTIIKPLKSNLLHFQLMLNKHRNMPMKEEELLEYKGMSYFWIEKLKKYTWKIQEKKRGIYTEYIRRLGTAGMTPTQKIMIIECMFRELEL